LADLLRLIVKRVTDDVPGLALEVQEWIYKHAGLGPRYSWPGNFRELEQCAWNVLIRKEYRPARLERKGNPVEDLAEAVRQGTLNADELERRYATLIFAKTGSYQETSRRLGRNWRTIKSKIDPALLRELPGTNSALS
jgi:DNA-binding NtrC family response regulator